MDNSTIGIKVADGTYFPVMEEDNTVKKKLVLTTVNDEQNSVQIDLYKGLGQELDNAVYLGSLLIEDIKPALKGTPEIELILGIDENGNLNAEAGASGEGERQSLSVSLESLNANEFTTPNFELDELSNEDFASIDGNIDDLNKIGDFDDEPGLDGEDIFGDLPKLDVEEPESVDLDVSFDPEETIVPEDSFNVRASLVNEPFDAAESGIDESGLDTSELDTSELNTSELDTSDLDTSDLDTSDLDTSDLDTSDLDDEFSEDAFSVSGMEDSDLDDLGETEVDKAELDTSGLDEAELDISGLDDLGATAADEPEFDASDLDVTELDTSELNEPELDTSGLDDEFSEEGFDDFPGDDFSEDDLSVDDFATDGFPENDFAEDSFSDSVKSDNTGDYTSNENEKKRRPLALIILIIIILAILGIGALFFFRGVKGDSIPQLEAENGNTDSVVTAVDEDSEMPVELEKQAEPQPEEQPEPQQEKQAEPEPEEQPEPQQEKPAEPEPEVSGAVAVDNDESSVAEAEPVTSVDYTEVPPEGRGGGVWYRLKWGDTLWDLSNSFYRTPWLYSLIAVKNKIKNPDVTYAGTDILIPEN